MPCNCLSSSIQQSTHMCIEYLLTLVECLSLSAFVAFQFMHLFETNFTFPVLMQCNYRFFYIFISTSTVLCLYVFAFSWYIIIHQRGTIWEAISNDYLSDGLIVYCFIAFWFVGGLTVFHFYLISTNQVIFLRTFVFRFLYDVAIHVSVS